MTGPAPVASRMPLADPMIRVRRRYHLHLPGLVYALTTLFLAVGAVNSQNNLLFWAFGLAVAGMLVSGIISGAALMGVEVERLPPAPVIAGGDLLIRYKVRNRNRLFPAFALHITETPDRRDPARDWRAILRPPSAFVVHVGPRHTVEAEARCATRARGEALLDTLSVWTVFPFGLARKSVTFRERRRVVVRPAPAAVDLAALDDRHETGASAPRTHRRSPTPGEFFALREFRPGDSPRAVAWRASARAGVTLIRQYAASQHARLWIVLELGDDAERGEHAISIAAGAIDNARRRTSPTGLVVPSLGLRTPAREGRGHAESLLDALATIPATTTGPHPLLSLGPEQSTSDGVVIISARDAAAPPPRPNVSFVPAPRPRPQGAGA